MHLILATSLIGLPVVSEKSKKTFGQVSGTFFDTDKGCLIGLTIKNGWFKPLDFVYLDDVVSANRFALTIEKPDNVKPINKIQPLAKKYHKSTSLIGLKVVTQSGKTLGKVSDLSISLSTSLLMSVYITKMWSEVIIPRHKIVEITKKKIIVDDDTRLPQNVAPAEVS